MPQSTAKKQLLEQCFDEGTPVKKLVSRDINSWMQTHQKSQRNKKNIQAPRFKISRRLPPKYSMASKQRQQTTELQNKQTPNIEQLKKRKQTLMKTLTIKKWVSNQNTKPNTAQESSNKNKKPLEWLMRLPLIHVNEFITEQEDKKQFQQVTLIPELRGLPLKTNAITTRKSSLKRFDRKQGSKSPYCHYKEASQRNNSAQMKQILHEKLNNKYAGLSSVSRKSSKLNYQIKIDKYTVRM